ncbi:single-stranded-DNA-specific exonuclease RecJ [Pseudemcibacter aquimaris]|uniref:single-stranded-DNA-specific exonuclease RecJ n=1 Tax=Pseudemcibacter aquimaris TaxID=2857064 RepID=UPI0020135EDA|nr:single-stranded-DNA-specific exonuclease RecJ [Pseudemcibacter aquimaris]MCC3860551.1 single-stranded-DNA-specific exonuclease RecJ [Pseudemcibacter aquimaris]WDU59374.1 single-stranded-DNA-specific exonuclease RecJ [Pseudemcibacter aquimaris]
MSDDAQTIADRELVLAVENSITGRAWVSRPAEPRFIQAIAQNHNLPEIVARVVVGRGISVENAEIFLNPTLREQLPDPSIFKDMDKACARIADAIMAGEKVAVFGDYDVDGATSSAIFKRFFKSIGQDITAYIPDRMEEGYGPNTKALLELKAAGHKLVITVDCGIVSFEPLAAATNAGLDMIVVDHHQAEAKLPDAVAVVNPNRLDEEPGYGQLAAIGVSFITIVGINRELRNRGWYKDQAIEEPKIIQWLDLVALGTICDVVPLTGVNRALVAQGLKIMAARGNQGLKALSDVAGISEEPGTYHAGFLLGPRVNAGGRVGRSEAGTILLSTDNEEEAIRISSELNTYNAERQAIEAMVLEDAMDQVTAKIGPGGVVPPVIIAAGNGWHPGVIGIVAGRLKEHFGRPTIVIAIDEHGDAKGSGRSIYGVDLGSAITAARQAEILTAGGGHAMAAGLSMRKEMLDDLEEFLTSRLKSKIDEAVATMSLKLDGALSLSAVDPTLVNQLDQIGPYGQGNAGPRFAFSDCFVSYVDIVGKDHVKCTLKGGDGSTVKAMAFRSADKPLGRFLIDSRGKAIKIAGTIRNNHWNGRTSAEIFIDDASE